MIEKIEWQRIKLGDVSPPPPEILQACKIPLPGFIINRTEVGPKRRPSLTREAALILLQLHPLLVWGQKHHCIGGLRTLTLTAPFLRPEDLLPVGIIPAKASQKELITLLEADNLLSQMAFGCHTGAKTIFTSSRKVDPMILAKWSPALAAGVLSSAELLGVTPQTLYNPHKKTTT